MIQGRTWKTKATAGGLSRRKDYMERKDFKGRLIGKTL
jgi:hypothetical protein